MTMNEANSKCLLQCAEIILQSDVKVFSTLKDISLFYKIINEPIINCDVNILFSKLSKTFNTNIENILNINNIDDLSDYELSKILLLCIVVYMLISNNNDKSNKFRNLCDNIPLYLHENASSMFAPLIIKCSEKIAITEEDIDSALLINDKENQTNYFSPIRENQRPHLINEKIITAQKRKIHQDIKTYHTFDPFPIENCSTSSIETTSPLVKLLQLVQSPQFHGKSLMKSNRELEKTVKRLEHQIYLNSSTESELNNTISNWKQKYKNLENDLKIVQSMANSKDDILSEKDDQIQRLQHLSMQNKRLDEKMKDYQEKTNEIQILTTQLEEKCEENKMLKIENREFNHFKALAIDRRIKIEHLSMELNNQRNHYAELTETRIRLSETESQLMELQNHMHSLQRNNMNESLSEISLNSSMLHAECMGEIVEIERDELKNELIQLREDTVSKLLYEEEKELNHSINKELDQVKLQFSAINREQENLKEYCHLVKEDLNRSTTSLDDNECSMTVLQQVKTIFNELNEMVSNQKDNIIQLITTNNDLTAKLNHQIEFEKELHNTIKILNDTTEEKNKYLVSIGQLLFKNEEICWDKDEYLTDILTKLSSNDKIIQQTQMVENELQTVNNMFHDKLRILTNTLTNIADKDITSDITSDIVLITHPLFTDDLDNYFIKCLNELHHKFTEQISTIILLKEEILQLNNEKKSLEHNLEMANNDYNNNLIVVKLELEKSNEENLILVVEQFNQMKEELIADYTMKEVTMRNDLTNLRQEYQEYLRNFQIITVDFEENIKIKDEEIENNKNKWHKLEEEMMLFKNEVEVANSIIKKQEEEISTMQINMDNKCRELLVKEEILNELQKSDREHKEKYQLCVRDSQTDKCNFEETLKIKNDEIENERIKSDNMNNEVIKMQQELKNAERNRDELLIRFNEEIDTKKHDLEHQLSMKDEEIMKLELIISNTQDIINTISQEININDNNKDMESALLDGVEHCLLKKSNTIKLTLNNYGLAIERLIEDVNKKDETISVMQHKIDGLCQQLMTKNNELCELEKIQLRNTTKHQQSLNQLTIVDQQMEEVKHHYENKIQQYIISLQNKDDEVKYHKSLLDKCNDNINELQMTLTNKNNEFTGLISEHSIQINNCKHQCQEQEMNYQLQLSNQIQESNIHKTTISQTMDQLSMNNNNTIAQLTKQLQETEAKQLNSLIKCQYLVDIDQKYVNLTKEHEELKRRLDKCNGEFIQTIQLKIDEIEALKCQLDTVQISTRQSEIINTEMREEISTLNANIESFNTIKKSLEDKCLDVDQRYNSLLQERNGLICLLDDKTRMVNDLHCTIQQLNETSTQLTTSLTHCKDEISILQDNITIRDKQIHIANDSNNDHILQITTFTSLLQDQYDCVLIKDKEIQKNNELIHQLQSRDRDLNNSIIELQQHIADMEQSNQLKMTNIEDLQQQLLSQKELLETTECQFKQKIQLLLAQLHDVTQEKTTKTKELSVANDSLVQFNNKIKNLEFIINDEMVNYQKVTEECRHVEQESHQYKEKFNKMVKQNHEEIGQYQSKILELTNQIDKIEEERDSQIHEMEKLFNAKIFDLQQNIEDKTSEMESMKKEIVETRKTNKTARTNLEVEKERLQKAMLTRQNQYGEEKAQLIINIDKERDEKLKYKNDYEEKIVKLENDMKIANEKNSVDLKHLQLDLDNCNERLKEAKLIGFRATEELKQKDCEFKKSIKSMKIRIKELEPLENQIENFESTTQRLMAKLNELENCDNLKEIRTLRLEMKANVNKLKIMEKEKEDFISKRVSLENKMKNLLRQNNEILKDKKELEGKINYFKDQIHELESVDKTRLLKIENIETEIQSIRSENESLKYRYLKMTKISETNMDKVAKSHEETIKNYIDRLGTLTKDVSNFQEQIQFLIVKNNMLKEENGNLKKSVAEITSKFNNLKTVLREHTEKEMKQLCEKYTESNRYSRMTQWATRPQLTRQLPPINSLDKDSVIALELNTSSKRRFESYVFSPYTCEDESSILLQKELTSASSRPSSINKIDNNKSNNVTPQLVTPIKKKKDGIRHQITTRIRRSLHMETNKNNEEVYQTPTLKKNDSLSKNEKQANAKPPMMPRNKKMPVNLRTSQLNVIDLDEFRHKTNKKILTTPCKQDKFDDPESIYSVTSTTASNIAPTTSVCSLFDQGDGFVNRAVDNFFTTGSPNCTGKDIEIKSLGSPFTQRPKTPKPNSIIKRLIRKSKNRTPRVKHTSFDKLLQ